MNKTFGPEPLFEVHLEDVTGKKHVRRIYAATESDAVDRLDGLTSRDGLALTVQDVQWVR